MIEYIRGILTSKSPTTVVIETGGVGYLVNISLNTYNALGHAGEQTEVRLFTHEVLREDAHDLYGFIDLGERQIFRLLISVSGIGPAIGRLILSTFSTHDLVSVIASGDANSLKTVKGVGTKTAQRVILDLKDKVVTEMVDYVEAKDIQVGVGETTPDRQKLYDEAEQAFITLGYTKTMAHKVISKLVKQDPSMSVDEIIRQGLRMM